MKFRPLLAAAFASAAITLTACGTTATPSADPSAATVQSGPATAEIPDPAAFIAAAPPDTRPYLEWALERHESFIFLANNGRGRTCMTWVLQSDGTVVAFAGAGPYRGGLLSAQRLTDVPQAEWAETLQCTMPAGWISVAPIPDPLK